MPERFALAPSRSLHVGEMAPVDEPTADDIVKAFHSWMVEQGRPVSTSKTYSNTIRRLIRGGLGLEALCSLGNTVNTTDRSAVRAFQEFRSVSVVLEAFHDWMLEQGWSVDRSIQLKNNMRGALHSQAKYRDAVHAFLGFLDSTIRSKPQSRRGGTGTVRFRIQTLASLFASWRSWLGGSEVLLYARLMARIAKLFQGRACATSPSSVPEGGSPTPLLLPGDASGENTPKKRRLVSDGGCGDGVCGDGVLKENTPSDANTSEGCVDALAPKKRRLVTPAFIDDSGPVVPFTPALRQEVHAICCAKLKIVFGQS